MTRDAFKAELDRRYRRADPGTRAWSTAFHFTFGIAAVAGVLVAAVTASKVVTIDGVDVTPYIPFVAVLGSICSAIGGFGGFERKWQANRITRNEIDILRIKLANADNSDPLTNHLADQLVGILRVHDAGILQRADKPSAALPSAETEPVTL